MALLTDNTNTDVLGVPLRLDVPAQAEVVVIGGGIVGLATAHYLLDQGLDPIVLDPSPASYATHAAAGMLASISEVQFRQEPLVPLMQEAAELYPRVFERLGVDPAVVGFRDTRTLVCGFDSADKASLGDLAAYQRELGLDVEPITVRQARKYEPVLSPAMAGAVEIVRDHQVNPRWLAQEFLKALGGRVIGARATEILVEDRKGTACAHAVRWSRTTTNSAGEEREETGTIQAQHVLVANGMQANTLAGEHLDDLRRLPLREVYGDVLRLRVPPSQRPFLTSTIRGVVRGNPVYIVPRQDNTVVVGATSREDGMPGISAGGVYQLLRDAQLLVPAIAELELYEVISRARPGSPDDIPMVGAVRSNRIGKDIENLTVATGFFRHGILLSAWAAQAVGDLVLGRQASGRAGQALADCSLYRSTVLGRD